MGEPMALSASDVVLAEGTPEQRQLAWQLNGVSWAPPMPIDTYVAREEQLSQHELCRDGRCKYWVIYLKGYPRQIIASCETTRKTVLIARDGVSRKGHGYAIASVYTNPAYRRLGMAAFLLRRVQEQMDLDSDFSVLYSDIGRSYYSSLGWRVFPSYQVTLSLVGRAAPPSPTTATSSPPPSPPVPFQHSQPARTRHLKLEDLPALCEQDETYLAQQFAALPSGDGMTHVAFSPSFAQISWQLTRAGFMAERLFGGKAVPNKGAITESGRSWLYWHHDFRERKLKVLRIVSLLDEATAEQQRIVDNKVLLEAALAEASAWGLPSVLVWDPDEHTTLGCKAAGNTHPEDVKIVFDERKDKSVPSFRWARGEDSRQTVWEDSFYYCWC
ncbi:hypothetical protein B0T26DRAFT_657799 [Lasiosphaeria miniovina]|uniref:N-acetyltransferase domain-containing protein n=1 Tax=Lasiosphaeria miniovina TaxID=1954250 RepID=A0AA39ZTQ6_9PEZI|nr:uncharacterized protein B0T26DRAFT_657799 [Lasiosphaeria miniovina]KAK0703561.1 hypothetical protein B0T26DRAFT_657799 [Lasiosphaeria miniovina]